MHSVCLALLLYCGAAQSPMDVLAASDCAKATLHEFDTRGSLALKFPAPDSIPDCLSHEEARKFCYVKHELALNPGVSISTSIALCLPEKCSAADSRDFLDRLCLIPSCQALAPVPSLMSLCAALQPLHCDPQNRLAPLKSEFSNVTLECLAQSDYSDADVTIVDGRRRRLQPTANANEVALTANEMEALVRCGSNTFRHWETLALSGSLQELGDYETCVEGNEHRYCVIKYYGMLTSGRCVPESCAMSNFEDLFDFVCTRIGAEDGNVPGMRSCLDFLDVIPLDLCVIMQMLGCSKAIEMSVLNKAGPAAAFEDLFKPRNHQSPELMKAQWALEDVVNEKDLHWLPSNGLMVKAVQTYTLGAVSNALEALRNVHPELMDAGPSRSEANYTGVGLSVFSRLSELSQDNVIDEGMFGAGSVRSYQMVCDFTPISTSKPDFAIALTLLGLFFLLFPLLGLFGRPLKVPGHPRDEPEEPPRQLSKFEKWRKTSSLAKFLGAFSVANNIAKLQRSQRTLFHGPFNHISGMRVFSMIWIVAGHTFVFFMYSGVMKNIAYIQEIFQRYTFQLIISAQLSVDTFFFFSGLLLSVYGTKKIHSAISQICASSANLVKRIVKICGAVCVIVLRRYFRLVPTMLFVMSIAYWGVQYLGMGPNWPTLLMILRTGIHGGCQKYWWANALMVNNLLDGSASMECFGHGWYLANDFQFFILGTLLITLGYWGPRTFRLTAALVIVSSILISAKVAVMYDVKFSMSGYSGVPSGEEDASLAGGTLRVMAHYYNKPWCRAGPYVIGLLCGAWYREGLFVKWLLKENTHRVQKGPQEIDGVLVSLGHLAAGAMMFSLVFAIPYNANKEDAEPWNRIIDVIYLATSRSVWALCLGWFTLVLAYSPLNPENETPKGEEDVVVIDDPVTRGLKHILSGSTMCFLALMIYGAYLVHPVIQQTFYALAPTAQSITELNGWFDSIFHSGLALGIAVVLYVTVETVFANLFALIGL